MGNTRNGDSGWMTPSAVATALAERTAAGQVDYDEAKEYFRCFDALARAGADRDECLTALDVLLDAARSGNVLGRGNLVIAANVQAGYGRVQAAVDTMVAAYRVQPETFGGTHPTSAVHRLRPHGPDAVAAFVEALRVAGVPLNLERDSSSVVARLERARDAKELTGAVQALVEAGGFPDVVAAGRAMTVLRSSSGRSAEHVTRLFRLAASSCGLSPRMVNDALSILAELGAADESAALLAEAEAAGHEVVGVHLVTHMTALNNALRYDEALAVYERYLRAGHQATPRARRAQLTALCWGEQPDRVRAALQDWAEAARGGGVEDPAPGLLTTALNALAVDEVAAMVDVVEGTADVFDWNDAHRRLVLGVTRRSRGLLDHARALATFAADRPATPAELEVLLKLTRDGYPEDVIVALSRVCHADPTSRPVLAGALGAAQLAAGDLAAAEETARAAVDLVLAEGVTCAHLDAGDIDDALRALAVFEIGQAGTDASHRGLVPYPPTLVGRVVRALAARRSVAEAEQWLARYPERAWPAEAWESLASAYRRTKGNVSAIEGLMRRMRAAGTRPMGNVWAQWLYSFPRAKRAARVPRALTAMRADQQTPTPSFFTAAIVGALQPAKVVVPPGGDVEAIAWTNARRAIAAGERLLDKAVLTLVHDGGPGGDPGSWFSAGQLLEIARAYPLARRPYAQVDTAVEVRLAEETEAADQFVAFLGALAAAHARALLPEGVRRLRAVAAKVGQADRPDLSAALLDSLADGTSARAVVLAEIESGHLASSLVAEAAGRALAREGRAGVFVEVLDAATPPLPEEQAERLLSSAVLGCADAGQLEAARQIGLIAEQRGLGLSPGAQAVLLATHRPAGPVQQDHGPVWTTDQLAAYNGLLQHEFANQLQTSRTRTRLMSSAVRRLRDELGPELTSDAIRYLDVLDDVEAALRQTQDAQQKTIDKIAAAAQQERTAAGVVPVLETIDAVAAQLLGEAAEARTDIRVLDRDDTARAMVRGHATLVHFALHNLVSNALKAHKRCKDDVRREIEVLATFAESDREDLAVAPYGWVIVSVRDHGDGVPDDLPDNVANWSIPGQPGQGAGIGLSRTENMLRGSGGRLWIDTSVTGGSRFCFRLPSAARRQVRSASMPQSPREETNHA